MVWGQTWESEAFVPPRADVRARESLGLEIMASPNVDQMFSVGQKTKAGCGSQGHLVITRPHLCNLLAHPSADFHIHLQGRLAGMSSMLKTGKLRLRETDHLPEDTQ
jgi:hypothetical protein